LQFLWEWCLQWSLRSPFLPSWAAIA
jgi:hypothetical protein